MSEPEEEKVPNKDIKVLVSKLGLDGHDRGLKVVSKALKDAGFNVTYQGVHRTVDSVVEQAEKRDVDVIGVSILSGTHTELIQDLMKQMKRKGMNKPVIVGGVIPPKDVKKLLDMGVFKVFGPGSSLDEIIKAIREAALKAIGERKRRLKKLIISG
jgi:methylmalonyl-CoA mutase C-terminal domain/subunit